jgi:hypothetical protein
MPAGKLARAAVFSALPSMNQASKPQSHQASLSGRCTTHPAALAPKTQPKNATQSSNPLTPSSSPRSFAALRSKAALATQPTSPGENKRARQSPRHYPIHFRIHSRIQQLLPHHIHLSFTRQWLRVHTGREQSSRCRFLVASGSNSFASETASIGQPQVNRYENSDYRG